MNIERLIEAAKEIERLCVLQDERTKKLQELASRARTADKREHSNIMLEANMLGTTVVDFGGAINAVRFALKAKPAKKERQRD